MTVTGKPNTMSHHQTTGHLKSGAWGRGRFKREDSSTSKRTWGTYSRSQRVAFPGPSRKRRSRAGPNSRGQPPAHSARLLALGRPGHHRPQVHLLSSPGARRAQPARLASSRIWRPCWSSEMATRPRTRVPEKGKTRSDQGSASRGGRGGCVGAGASVWSTTIWPHSHPRVLSLSSQGDPVAGRSALMVRVAGPRGLSQLCPLPSARPLPGPPRLWPG